MRDNAGFLLHRAFRVGSVKKGYAKKIEFVLIKEDPKAISYLTEDEFNDIMQLDIIDLAKKLFELAGVNPIFEMLSAPQCSVKRRCPNIDKIKKLGYSVKYSTEYGLEKTYQSYKDK